MSEKNRIKIPMYKQLEKVIKDKIYNNEFAPGTKLPTESSLAALYGVSNTTIRKAIVILEEQGIVRRLEGQGVIVNPIVSGKNILNLAGVISEKEVGESKIVEQFMRECGAYYQDVFECDSNSILYFTRLANKQGKEVVSIEDILLPKNIFPDFENVDLRNVSIIDYIHSKPYSTLKLKQTIEVIGVDNKLAKLLSINKSDVVLNFSTKIVTSKDTTIALTNKYIPSGKNAYKVDFFI